MEKNRWKKWAFVVLTTVLAFGLAACGTNNDSTGNEGTESGTGDGAADGEKIDLEFWSFWGGGARRETIEAIIKDFNDSQDEIEVTHVYQPWGDIWTKSLAAIASGNDVPDVIVQDINSVRQRAEANQATNLAKYLNKEDENLEDLFYPQLWDTVIYEDEAYGLPFNTDTQVLFYNKDLFEEVGLDPDTPPATWKEIEEMARKLDVQEGDSWERLGFYPLWNLGLDVWSLNADNGTSWFDENDEVKINTPRKVEAVEWVLDWQDHYGQDTINSYEAEFGSGVTDPFVSGLVAMRGQNINYYTELKENTPDDFNFGVAPLPKFDEESEPWSWGGGFVLEIPYGAENPDASYEFMKYLTSTEVQTRFGASSFDIMANKAANEALVDHPDLDEKGHMIYELADKNFEYTVITPVPLTAPDYNQLVNGELDQALLGSKTAKEALDDAQASVEDLVEQNQ